MDLEKQVTEQEVVETEATRGLPMWGVLVAAQAPLLALGVLLLLVDVGSPAAEAGLLAAAAGLGFAFAFAALRPWMRSVKRASDVIRTYLEGGQLTQWAVGPRAPGILGDATQAIQRLDWLNRRYQRTTYIDPLSPAYSQRFALERLKQDLSRQQRGAGGFTLALVMLDQFEAIRDRKGQKALEAVLWTVGRHLVTHVRAGDWVARWSGGAFLICFWGASAAQAREACLRLSDGLANTPCESTEGTFSISVSSGILKAEQAESVEVLQEQVAPAILEIRKKGHNSIVLL